MMGWVLGYSFAYHELMVAWILSRGGGGDGWVGAVVAYVIPRKPKRGSRV